MSHADRTARMLKRMRNRRGIAITVVFRDGTRIDIAKAIKTNPVSSTANAQGQMLRFQASDWLIDAEDLVHDDELFLPEKDMRIEELVDGGEEKDVYQIQPFGDRRGNVYEKSDAAGSQFRVHSNYITTEDVEE